jgi:hypothetical protein
MRTSPLSPEQALAVLREHGFDPADKSLTDLTRWVAGTPHFPVSIKRILEAFVRAGS